MPTNTSSLATRQAVLAKFIDDPSFERWLRSHPEQATKQYALPSGFARWLAQIQPRRLRQFRRSRVHKQRIRSGEPAPRVKVGTPKEG